MQHIGVRKGEIFSPSRAHFWRLGRGPLWITSGKFPPACGLKSPIFGAGGLSAARRGSSPGIPYVPPAPMLQAQIQVGLVVAMAVAMLVRMLLGFVGLVLSMFISLVVFAFGVLL